MENDILIREKRFHNEWAGNLKRKKFLKSDVGLEKPTSTLLSMASMLLPRISQREW